MPPQRRIVERNTRHPAPPPGSTPYINPYGMTAQHIHRMNKAVRQHRQDRPPVVVRPRATGLDPLLSLPLPMASHSVEYPAPAWFVQRGKVQVSVIVPLYRSHEVVADLIRHWPLDGPSHEIIFVDDACPNNSKDVVIREWTRRWGELKAPVGRVIVNATNKGYGQACNTGAEYARGDVLVFLNADTRVTPGWLEPFVELLADRGIGLVGNLQIKDGGQWHGTVDGAGSEWSWEAGCFEHIGRHSLFGRRLAQPLRPEDLPDEIMQDGDREMVTGCCFGITRRLFRYLGGHNPNYRIGYWEDAELSMTVRELGLRVVFTPRSVIHHKLSHTHSGGHKYADYNRLFFHNRWVRSGRLHRLVQAKAEPPAVRRVLLRRSGARGDVLVAAGVAAALKRQHDCEVLFLTDCPDVLDRHPFVDRIIHYGEVTDRLYDVFYDLDLVYEYRPQANILQTYAEYVGVPPAECEVRVATTPFMTPEGAVVIHAGKTAWVGRNWTAEGFRVVAETLRSRGIPVVVVGGADDHTMPCDLDLRGKTSVGHLADVLSRARLFVGIDSMPMHVAQAVNCPGVVFFGSVLPATRLYRANMHAVTKPMLCLGCHHRRPAPSVVTSSCEVGGEPCITMVTPEEGLARIDVAMEASEPGGFVAADAT